MTAPGPETQVLDEPPALAGSVELVRRGQQGDRAALGELFARYQDRVRRIVSIRMGSQFRGLLDSLDLTQDTWMAAMRGLPGFEPRDHGSIIRWLARIAENQVLDAADRVHAARRDRRRERAADELGAASGDAGVGAGAGAGAAAIFPAASCPSPSEAATQRELREVYDACVAELPDPFREVVLLKDYSLLDWPEVREQLGRPSVHATQELYRRAQLRLGELLRRRMNG
jgi:RNA polymerase sigma-70 factor, ECF subfamily